MRAELHFIGIMGALVGLILLMEAIERFARWRRKHKSRRSDA